MDQGLLNPSPSDLMEVLGALTFALAKAMPDVERSRFVTRLDNLALIAERQGKPGVMAGLQQLAGAARVTPP
jgi:hypothetical protein